MTFWVPWVPMVALGCLQVASGRLCVPLGIAPPTLRSAAGTHHNEQKNLIVLELVIRCIEQRIQNEVNKHIIRAIIVHGSKRIQYETYRKRAQYKYNTNSIIIISSMSSLYIMTHMRFCTSLEEPAASTPKQQSDYKEQCNCILTILMH